MPVSTTPGNSPAQAPPTNQPEQAVPIASINTATMSCPTPLADTPLATVPTATQQRSSIPAVASHVPATPTTPSRGLSKSDPITLDDSDEDPHSVGKLSAFKAESADVASPGLVSSEIVMRRPGRTPQNTTPSQKKTTPTKLIHQAASKLIDLSEVEALSRWTLYYGNSQYDFF